MTVKQYEGMEIACYITLNIGVMVSFFPIFPDRLFLEGRDYIIFTFMSSILTTMLYKHSAHAELMIE